MTRNGVITGFRAALGSIGYEDRFISRDYAFADFTDRAATLNHIALAAFSSYPPSYRNACIGVALSNGASGGDGLVARYRALGAPLLFEVTDGEIQPWAIGPDHAKSAGDAFTIDQIERAFEKNKARWKPDALGRVKSPSDVKANPQLDFYDLGLLPALEQFFQTKLKDMLERAFRTTADCYKSVHGQDPAVTFLFPYLFRFVTAKVFMDRADAKGWDGLDSPRKIFEKAEKHSGAGLLDQLPKEFLDRRVLEMAWNSISQTLHFQNLSAPDLAFIYESSFITESTRRELGIHSTPRGLAEYIVNHLPWQDIPVNERRIFEPFGGHGIFLACAMERLGEDLEAGWGPKRRHAYFRDMLVGVEKDALALEVCRLMLTLSDYPNDNSWQLHLDDVFTWQGWDAALKSAAVVLANPPYEAFSESERARVSAVRSHPPAEFLRRLMRQPPRMLGLVLPQSFLTSPFYREANKQIACRFEQVSIVELPRLFRYADNETIALLAWGRRETGEKVSIRYSQVSLPDTDAFLQDYKVSAVRSKRVLISDDTAPFSLWIPPKESLLTRFSSYSTLGHVCARIRQGIHWKGRSDGKPRTAPRTDVATDSPTPGFHLGAEKMAGNLAQFQVRIFRYLSLLEKDQDPRTRAHKNPWSASKVVCNAARFERHSPWRIAAWSDIDGLAFTKQYFAIWPNDGISTFAISAVLCSPLANAYSFEKDLDKHNHISTLTSLPIPHVELLRSNGKLDRVSRNLQALLAPKQLAAEPAADDVREALIRVDAAVLEAYELTAREQRTLLDQFTGWKRPVPIPFTGYFPDDFKEFISLKDFVSINYDWDTVNERRCDLIEKEISRQSMTDDERWELEHLQNLADLLIELKDPYPIKELDGLIDKLKAEGKWQDTI